MPVQKVPSKVRQRCRTFSGDAAYMEVAMQEFFDSEHHALELDVRTYQSEDAIGAVVLTAICFYAEVLEWSFFDESGTLLKTETVGGLVVPKVKLELTK